jgi:FkbM family methyltransferase
MQETSKHQEIMGAPATFFGRITDEYFARLPAYVAQNELLVRELLRLDRCASVIDVGANIGVTAVTSSRAVAGGRVLALEPSPTAFADLVRSLNASGCANCVPLCVAAGNPPATPWWSFGRRKRATAHFLQRDFVGGEVMAKKSPETIEVPLISLDDLVQEKGWDRVDLIKIDVDGPELDVLLGARNVLRRHRPRVVMEFSPYTLSYVGNVSPRAPLDFILEEFGSFEYFRDGQMARVSTDEEVRAFLFTSMARSAIAVDDIAFGGPGHSG